MYPFACKETFLERNVFMTMVSISMGAMTVFQFHPNYTLGSWRAIRAGLFIALGVSAGAPLIYLML